MSSSSEARAAAAAAAMCGDARALARLGGPDGSFGDDARAVHAAWAALDRGARAKGIAMAAASVRSPAPIGLALVHRDWIEAALAGEGARVRGVIAGTIGVAPDVRAYLERRVLGAFVAMPRAGSPPWTPDTIAAAPPEWLEAQLARAGLYQLAHAAADQPRVAVAMLAAQLGAMGARFVDAIAEVAGAPDASARWGARRGAIARVTGASFAADPLALVAIGARAFAPHLRGDAPRQLAQRLPRGLGLRVATELSRESIAAPPAWSELLR